MCLDKHTCPEKTHRASSGMLAVRETSMASGYGALAISISIIEQGSIHCSSLHLYPPKEKSVEHTKLQLIKKQNKTKTNAIGRARKGS